MLCYVGSVGDHIGGEGSPHQLESSVNHNVKHLPNESADTVNISQSETAEQALPTKNCPSATSAFPFNTHSPQNLLESCDAFVTSSNLLSSGLADSVTLPLPLSEATAEFTKVPTSVHVAPVPAASVPAATIAQFKPTPAPRSPRRQLPTITSARKLPALPLATVACSLDLADGDSSKKSLDSWDIIDFQPKTDSLRKEAETKRNFLVAVEESNNVEKVTVETLADQGEDNSVVQTPKPGDSIEEREPIGNNLELETDPVLPEAGVCDVTAQDFLPIQSSSVVGNSPVTQTDLEGQGEPAQMTQQTQLGESEDGEKICSSGDVYEQLLDGYQVRLPHKIVLSLVQFTAVGRHG